MDDDDDDLDLFALEDRDEACKYQRKIGGRNARSCTDEPIDVTQQHSGSNLEAKIKAIAHYLKNVGTNLRKHAREGRRERLALSQFTTHKSAPDVLGRPRLSIPIRMSNSGGPSSSRDHTTSKVDDCDSALVSPVQQASPPSRKRGRPSNAIFRDDELRTLCRRCDVPVKHVTEVADMIMAGFGTHLLDVIVLEELVGCNNIVLVVGMLVFTALDCGEEYMDMQRLPAFLRHVQVRYCAENPFHNACHAADVLHTLFMLFWNTTLGAKISGYNKVGALLAAVMHDIDHVGFTNDFLLKTNHDIAIQFPSKAPMEAMHAAMAVQLLGDSKYGLLSKMTPRQQTQVKKTVREVIIATALCYQRDMLNDMKQPTAEEVDVNDDVDVLPQTLQVLVLRCATHVSDISQTMKPFTVHQKWVARLNEEHFQQGDVDGRHGHGISPFFCFRHQLSHLAFLKCQVGFLMNVALPAVETLASVPWMDISILLEGIRNNIATWTSQLQDEESNVGDCISGSP
ncbi:TPA: hypothetical protein N0F65_005345 [Lagenidium giganteum]|uniref:Phosphodiesterase n=1 Tax=Lagenidium giganteum TaxID=4803 RepID=A0AAV2YYE7_9STRA|nr:TPA: hypothetical protein N0F65_005345 [Lagenidium giganteum]